MTAIPVDSASERLEALRRRLRPGEGMLVTNITNVRYLTGFTGSSGFVLVARGGAAFATDFRYMEQAGAEVQGLEVVRERKNRVSAIRALARRMGLRRLLVESSVTHEFFERLSSAGGPGVKAVKGVVERLRAVKDARELALVREAVRRAEAAFRKVRPFIKAGVRERAVALRLEEALKRQGCSRVPFDIIVASGPNSALPHARASERKLSAGDLVIIDWGGEAGGYFSDMTRTLLVRGKDTARKREVHGLVLRANREAMALVAPGVEAGRIDGAARGVISQAGYGREFGHALGHGVGLEVHEEPRVARGRRERVREGMVFTVEPGVYVPGLGGVRIEDMAAVREGGAEELTSLARGLQVVS
ncbi:MAG: aminopeptidase P family protein [Thermodesulfovibrionales bacterium]